MTAWATWIGSLHGGNQATNYTKSNNVAAEGNSMYNEANNLLAESQELLKQGKNDNTDADRV